jgi:hypothetical protein
MHSTKTAHPTWVDEYVRSIQQAFEHMVPGNWGPVDAFKIYDELQGMIIERIHEAVLNLKGRGVTPDDAAETFSTPSSIHNALFHLCIEYVAWRKKDKQKFREVAEYLVGMLSARRMEDVFALNKNVVHTNKEIEDILRAVPWEKGTPEAARILGKLYNSAAALAFSLYRDFFPQESNEVYGPYDTSAKFGLGTILVIKHFTKMRPIELWPWAKDFKTSEIKIYCIYKDVTFRCEFIGMHSVYTGDLARGLQAYAVEIDGQFENDKGKLNALTEELEKIAVDKFQITARFTNEEAKQKVLEWVCYQFNKFFELAGMDWHPTQEMMERARAAKIPDRCIIERAPTLDEYWNSPEYEGYWLKDLYT